MLSLIFAVCLIVRLRRRNNEFKAKEVEPAALLCKTCASGDELPLHPRYLSLISNLPSFSTIESVVEVA
jgi:hypothetical protein